MKNYAAYAPTILVVLLLVCALLTYLCVCTVRYYQAARQVKQLTSEVVDLTDEVGRLSEMHETKDELFAESMRRVTTLRDENSALRKDISEMEDEITSSRAERRPFDPKLAAPTRLLAQIVAAECGPTATYAECRMVAQVIVNRAAKYHKTILEIITKPGQFTPVTSGAWLWATPTPIETAAAYNAVNRIDAVDGWGDAQLRQVLYFCAAGHADEFFRDRLVLVRRIGDTEFYREKGVTA